MRLIEETADGSLLVKMTKSEFEQIVSGQPKKHRYFQKCVTCKGKAFEWKRTPQFGEDPTIENCIELKRGQFAPNGDLLECASCGEVQHILAPGGVLAVNLLVEEVA